MSRGFAHSVTMEPWLSTHSGTKPLILTPAFVHPDAVIIGDVRVGPESSVWPTAVLRGDHGSIVVGSQTSIQDGTIVHCTDTQDTIIGDRCVVGHNAHLEGCRVEDDSLIGSGSVLLHGVVGPQALVGAGAVVSPGTVVPPHARASAFRLASPRTLWMPVTSPPTLTCTTTRAGTPRICDASTDEV